MLACSDECHRNADLNQGSGLGCRIVLGQNQCIDANGLVEYLGLADGVLAGSCIDDQNLLVVLGFDPVADDLVYLDRKSTL